MDLAVIDSNDAWCITVNKDGSSSLLRFDGESWNKVESAETTYAPQSSIYALDSSHIWVTRLLEDSPRNNGLGCPRGVIEFYNGVELTKQFEIDERIVSIAMPSRTRLWACTPDKMFTTELQE